MEKKELFGLLALLSFSAIFFTPGETGLWKFFLLIAVLFTITWWIKK